MRLAALFLFGTAATAATAQDRTRLDEFALPASEQAVAVDQLPSGERLPQEQPRDRSLRVPQPPAAKPEPVAQLAPFGEAGPTSQLTNRDRSGGVEPASISSVDQSKPAPTAPIKGSDRCDPQRLEGEERAKCLHILELRAAEFNATEAPVLSAEEKLLAEQQRREGVSRSSPAIRLDLASSDHPDADLATNQELAALYLQTANQPSQSSSRRPPEETEPGGDLVEALKGVLPPDLVQN